MHEKPLIDRGFERFLATYNAPGYDFNINVARLFVCAFLIWKLFSRDYGFFGTVPEELFYFYPYQLYPMDKWILWTGLPVIQELLTFHWIHWILPHPSVNVLRGIQAAAMLSLACLAVFGKGPKSAILIVTYSLLIYLWGYLFLLGQDIDAVAIYFGILVALGISRHADVPVWKLPALYRQPKSIDGGRAFSTVLLVFVFYYFASGVNKLTDISFLEWLQFDLVGAIERHSIVAAHHTVDTIDFFQILHGMTYFNYFGAPAVYISHICVPFVFFRRRMIFKFFIFYLMFHLLTFGVGISFSGYIFVWSVLFPWRELLDYLSRMRGKYSLAEQDR